MFYNIKITVEEVREGFRGKSNSLGFRKQMDNQQVTLNVGGTIFQTSKEILQRSDFFRSMFEDHILDVGPIFIDRSPHIFKHVLSYLWDPDYPYPKKYKKELKYYQINKNEVKFYDPLGELIQEPKVPRDERCERDKCKNRALETINVPNIASYALTMMKMLGVIMRGIILPAMGKCVRETPRPLKHKQALVCC